MSAIMGWMQNACNSIAVFDAMGRRVFTITGEADDFTEDELYDILGMLERAGIKQIPDDEDSHA